MKSRQPLQAALLDANVHAFLAVIRAGEGTADADGYRRMFGGRLFEGWADHPRQALTYRLGRSNITSTAAGAYQFLARTWDGLVRQYGFENFSPNQQDHAAVALIIGRRALDDVLAGRIEQAIARCNREWASLPGSPYGQPVRTMAQALATYAAAGGLLQPADAAAPPLAEPATDPTPASPPSPPPSPPSPESTMPLPLFLAAALPAIIDAIPKLGRLFGSGSAVAERNVKAAELAVQIVQDATGARNAQETVEILAADPAAAQAAVAAVEARWFELSEAGGGGIEGARKANEVYAQPDGPRFWFNPAFWVSLLLLTMPMMLLVDVFFVHPDTYAGELRTQIVTGVLMVIGMIGGYWIGTSFSSARKSEMLGK